MVPILTLLAWPIVVLILGIILLSILGEYARSLSNMEAANERDIAQLRKDTQAEFVAAKQAFLNASGALEARIRDLEMKVN